MVVNEKYTSKTCSNCGHVRKSLDLSVRRWKCHGCGIVHDRDVNAARNIFNRRNYGDLPYGKTNIIID